MKYEYDPDLKAYKLQMSIVDKCSCCGNAQDYCPLIKELESVDQNIMIRKGSFNITECKLYFYDPDPNLKDEYNGIYFGDGCKDLGYDLDNM